MSQKWNGVCQNFSKTYLLVKFLWSKQCTFRKKMYFAPIVFVFDPFAWSDEKGFDIAIIMYHIKYAT